ncbi:hypothetical protein FE88_22210 [Azospirillum brasilense]|nr:hypothetical protein AMK58_28850 [Azospirillum brasilense]OPH12628.1 hypothetical protein FE89_26870 [Azospirillum brasilense]OPH19074.1 hypothetical protein FE88_22210 [Azospirillum brasilense]PWC96849.1 hypothetical protein AEJ54_03295 [Azospirillum sp. Sp 7]QEL94755.1 hypothetical protein D9621_31935 [Azospirillum brasilense]
MLFLVVLLSLAVRLPFFTSPLVGEEGGHAMLVLGEETVGQRTANGFPQIMIGRIGGSDLFVSFERNIVPYIFLDRVVRSAGWSSWIGADSVERISLASRMPFLTLFVIGGSVLLAAAFRSARTLSGVAMAVPFVIAGYILTTPLAVGASLQPQIDGSVGVLLVGITAWVIVLRSEKGWRIFVTSVLAGLVSGLGKHEWAVALVAATAVVWGIAMLQHRLAPGRQDAQAMRRMNGTAAGLVLGVALGVALCLMVSVQEYLYGIFLMERMTRGDKSILLQFLRNLPFTYPLWIMVAGAGLMLLVLFARRLLVERFVECVLAVWGMGIATGYLWSAWPGDGFPRYFMPALLLVGLSVLLGFSRALPALPRAVAPLLILCATAGMAVNVLSAYDKSERGVSITSYPGKSLSAFSQHLDTVITRAQTEGIIVVDSSSVGIYNKNIEFMSEALSWEGAVDYVRRFYPGLEGKLVATFE